MKAALLVIVLSLVVVGEAAAQAGGGGGGGGGGGRQRTGNPQCGSDLVVLLPDGTKRQYATLEAFFASFDTTMLDQGERERPAVAVDVVLKALSADWMEALACDNRSLHLPSGLPFEGREYLVWTGKRGLKAVREVRRGNYANKLEQIRKLTLHTSSKPAR